MELNSGTLGGGIPLSKFIQYIEALGFDNSNPTEYCFDGVGSGRFYFNPNIHIEIEAREDKRLGYEEYYYRATFWGGSNPVYNHDLRYLDDVGDVMAVVDKLIGYYVTSPDTMDRYDKFKDSLLCSIEREKKIKEVLGE